MAQSEPEISLDPGWFASVARLQGSEARRVDKAVDQFLSDPNHPSLNLHPVRSDPTGRLHTFRASGELRVLVAREDTLFILLEAGHHDAVYEKAERSRLVVNPRRRYIGLVERHSGAASTASAASPTPPAPPAPPPTAHPAMAGQDDGPGVLDHWSDAELQEAGFSDIQVGLLRRCRTEGDLCDLGLDDQGFDLAVELLEVTPEEWRAPRLGAGGGPAGRIREAITRFGAVAGLSPLLSPQEVSELAAAPVEDWMVFLHPDQRAAVERRYEGPARVRGSAGTGKTVVALHRAATLARRNRDAWRQDRTPVLFTTYIKSLPPVFASLYRRLPGTVDGEVEFVNLDKLAFAVCDEAGDRPALDPRAIDAAFEAAWDTVAGQDSRVASAGLSPAYLREEITSVIKGRGLTSPDEYLAIERTGRRTPLSATQRRQVWSLREEWDREMARRGTVDFADVVRRARDHARRRREPRYRAGIIDEAQDLTLVGLQLVRSLVNGPSGTDVPDGLFIAGDGGQRIYPGGFTLRQAGVEVRGRTTVLRHNYRNTQEIIRTAMAVAGQDDVDDLGDELRRGDAPAETDRPGAVPTLVIAPSFDDELRHVADQISALVGPEATIGHGDIAVAVATNEQAKQATGALQERGIPCLDLQRYDGTPSDRVKVGTHFRSKGLEFKAVFLPGLGTGSFPPARAAGRSAEELEERRARALAQLFVAMTRARDALCVLCTGEPAEELATAVGSFAVVRL